MNYGEPIYYRKNRGALFMIGLAHFQVPSIDLQVDICKGNVCGKSGQSQLESSGGGHGKSGM